MKFKLKNSNGYRIYVDIRRKTYSPILVAVADMDIIYWSFRSSSKGGDWAKGVDSRDRYFSQLKVSFY